MKNIMLSEKEIEIITSRRESEEIERNKVKSGLQMARDEQKEIQKLENDFEKCWILSSKKINKYIDDANIAIKKAVAVSEKSGIPFSVNLDCMPKERIYTPNSFYEKWSSVDENSVEGITSLPYYAFETEWEYWDIYDRAG